MVKFKTHNRQDIALCSDEKPSAAMQSFVSSTTSDIGFFDTANPVLINRVQNKSKGIKQSNLFPISAGNDLRMSTMRPNPYLSVARVMNFIPFMPSKTCICTTIESNRFYLEIMMNSPKPAERAGWMGKLHEHFDIFVTIEPVLDFDLSDMVALIKTCNPKQVNIGADSGNNNLPEPSKEKLLALIDELKKFTVIDQKRNLSRFLK